MTPADKLLDHFDRIAGSQPRFYTVSPDGTSHVMHMAVYDGFPEPGAITGFTLGLSHFHPPEGGHKELTISMRSADHAWALACGFMAYQLRERCPFICGDTINFHEQISESSRMNGFLITHPMRIPVADTRIDLGIRQIDLVELVPLYEEERLWLLRGGAPHSLLQAYPHSALLDPQRAPFHSEPAQPTGRPWWRFWETQ